MNAKNTNLFHIPFNNFKSNPSEVLTEITTEERRTLMESILCSSELLLLVQRGSFYWSSMRMLAQEYGAAKPHGNIGKKRGVVNEDAIYNPVVEFFESLMSQCKVRAMKVVRTMVGLRNSTDDTDAVYLPTYMSICSCYASYLDKLGYSLETFNDGNYKVGEWSGEDGEVAPPYVSLPTFYNIWKRDYGHVKVCHPAKDICTLCFQFMNHHKYSTGLSADSLADCSLFIDTPKQGEEEYGKQDEDEFESDRESNQQMKPKVDKPTEEESQNERLLGPDAQSDDNALETHEQMIARAYCHVEMARVQRLLYSDLILRARNDVNNKLNHLERSYTFVVDYGQNMEIPAGTASAGENFPLFPISKFHFDS
jgi:hypothetical protein